MQRMMAMNLFIAAIAGPAVLGAEISLPDGILYGFVRIDDRTMSKNDECTIYAKAADDQEPLAAYRLGALPFMEDRFALRFPFRVTDDGVTPAEGSAQAGQVVQIFVNLGEGQETYVVDAVVPSSGDARELELFMRASDLEAGQAAAQDETTHQTSHRATRSQGVCGALGIGMLPLLIGGMLALRLHRRR